MKPCIFCPNPRTTKRGEHVWDDWLNWDDGKPLRMLSTFVEFGRDGAFVREYKTRSVSVTKDVVCDKCNQEWMSDLSNNAKSILEGFIKHERPATLLPVGVLTIVAFAFMKSVVLDYSAEDERSPFVQPAMCARFRHSLTSGLPDDTIALPSGLQVWMAKYRRERRMENVYWIDALHLNAGPLRGYDILQITYVVGAFAFQLTFPKWRKRTRRRPPGPVITQHRIWDDAAIPIWPNVPIAMWPPAKYLDRASLEHFRYRFRIVNFS